MIRNLFSSKSVLKCNLDNKALVDLMDSWHTNDYFIKKKVNPNSVLVHKKYIQKVYEGVNIYISYHIEEHFLLLEVKPLSRSYFLFFIPPLTFIWLLNAGNDLGWYWLIPIVSFIFVCLLFKYTLKNEKYEIIKKMKELLSIQGIKYEEIEYSESYDFDNNSSQKPID
ncbi:MAG: hypothetical protein JKY03_01865 [Aureispira sp.]|nr:hypothetical protein [Aureispira sp.]